MIILSTLCSVSEAGWLFSKDETKDGAVSSTHWETTIQNMDNEIAEVRARRNAADLQTSAESDDVEDQCDAELVRLRKRKQEIVKSFAAWKNPTKSALESIDTKMVEVRARREAAELDDTSTENDAVLEQCHAELRSLKEEERKIKTSLEIPEEVKEVEKKERRKRQDKAFVFFFTLVLAVGIAYLFKEKAAKEKAAREKKAEDEKKAAKWKAAREKKAKDEKKAREKKAKDEKKAIATKLGVAVDKIVFVYPGKGLVQKGYDEVIKKGLEYLYLMKGTHITTRELIIKHPINIIGAGRDKTFVEGYGFQIKGKKEEGKNVVLKDMTICTPNAYLYRSGFGLTASGDGETGIDGLSWLCDSLTITQCGGTGVSAKNTKGRLINCVITQCANSGIFCYQNALIELEGDQTKVDGNGTYGGYDQGYFRPRKYPFYGLQTDTSSTIHLLFPLTKWSVSTNDQNDQNYGGNGTIKTVKSF